MQRKWMSAVCVCVRVCLCLCVSVCLRVCVIEIISKFVTQMCCIEQRPTSMAGCPLKYCSVPQYIISLCHTHISEIRSKKIFWTINHYTPKSFHANVHPVWWQLMILPWPTTVPANEHRNVCKVLVLLNFFYTVRSWMTNILRFSSSLSYVPRTQDFLLPYAKRVMKRPITMSKDTNTTATVAAWSSITGSSLFRSFAEDLKWKFIYYRFTWLLDF